MHTFTISNKLTADSMIPYMDNGIQVYRKLSYLITHDPLYVWNRLYNSNQKLSLAKCAHNKLMQVMQSRHPDLYKAKEKKKLRHIASNAYRNN